ncbi:MAG TPA: hypothetical protein VK658_19270 [Chryseolinea sp.]|nr:hypothetical protein [Chryseolinea sp.]
MRFIVQFIAIVITAHLLGLFLPWYACAAVAFIAGYFLKSSQNFLAGFLAIAVLWTFNAWMADLDSSSSLPLRVAQLLGVGSAGMVYVLTAVVGGLVGGFATMSGAMLKTEN